MAIERGMLQDLIFDNRALVSHRAMAAILGVILKLPPVKRAMAASRCGRAIWRRSAPGRGDGSQLTVDGSDTSELTVHS